jgi:hypothetical protein
VIVAERVSQGIANTIRQSHPLPFTPSPFACVLHLPV